MVCKVPEGVMLLGYRGSIAHNMYVPGTDPNSIDDVDLMGFVVADERNYLGLTQWGSRGTREVKEGKYDCVYYEAQKAFQLLLQGNPNVVGMLWLHPQHYLEMTAAGRELVESRRVFVGKHVYNAFAGYAYAQLKKMESRDPAELREYIAVTNELKYRGAHPNHKNTATLRPSGMLDQICLPEKFGSTLTGEELNAFNTSTDKLLQKLASYQKKGENIGYMGDKRKQLVVQHGYDAKNAAHCIRLLRMCREFLETGEMVVYRTKDAAELLDIKRGKWPLERVKALAEELFVEAKAARDKSDLPEKPDREGAERLLVRILRESLVASDIGRGGE